MSNPQKLQWIKLRCCAASGAPCSAASVLFFAPARLLEPARLVHEDLGLSTRRPHVSAVPVQVPDPLVPLIFQKVRVKNCQRLQRTHASAHICIRTFFGDDLPHLLKQNSLTLSYWASQSTTTHFFFARLVASFTHLKNLNAIKSSLRSLGVPLYDI